MKTAEVKIVQDESAPVPSEILAEAIVRLSDAASKLLAPGALTMKALCVLLKDYTGLPQWQIERVIDALPRLGKYYITPKLSKYGK